MKFSPKIILVIVFITSQVYSAYSPYNFLRLESSARSAGLAGSFVTVIDDPSAVFSNPASIYTVTTKSFNATFLKHILDINSGQINYVHQTNNGAIGGSISYLNYGSFKRTDRFANQLGTFSANDLSVGISYANELDSNFYYGATLKFIYIGLEEANSTALALDVGLLYLLPDERTNLGLSILHAGLPLSNIGTISEDLPLDLKAGISHRLRGLPLLINFALHHLTDKKDNFFEKFESFTIGGEFYFGNYLMLRLGYNNHIRKLTSIESNKKFSGFSGGVGVKTKDINIDYALAFYGSGAALHRFSIGFELNKLFE